MTHNHAALKQRQREERDGYPENIALRIHRALSWLDRAEQCEDDDGRFIFLWIGFNAAYANEFYDSGYFTEQKVFQNFIQRLVDLDQENVLYELLWTEFSGSVRLLLDNQYIFGPFWEYQNERMTEDVWQKKFAKAKAAASKALASHNTTVVLAIIFSRLYVLRNQLIHGGATWNSGVNRDQLRDSANILSKLVPQIIKILMDHPHEVWGEACYPVVS